MNFKIAAVQFSNDKNCFATLPRDCYSQVSRHKEISVFEVSVSDSHYVYISSKNNQASHGDKFIVNGLYGNKLGLKDSEEVIIRPYPNVPSCSQVSIEPLSVNDWEILERNAAFVESNLMDQIRVVWKGQIFPVWVERNICIFLKIGSLEPRADCAILCNETEVIVSPKLRTDLTSKETSSTEKGPIKKPNFFPDNELDGKGLKNAMMNDDDDEAIYPKKKSSKEKISPSRWNWKDWMPWLMRSYQTDDMEEFISDPGPVDKARRKLSVDKSHYSLQGGTNLSFRVQSLMANFNSDPSRNQTDELDGDTGEPDICWSLQDPTLVFVNREDIIEQFEGSKPTVPEMFLGKLTKLMSPKEMEKHASKLRKQTETEKSQEKKTIEKDGNQKKEESTKDKPIEAVVKVIVIDKKREMSSRKVEEVVCAMLSEQQCYRGHIVVPCLLRRLMGLEVSSRVWIKVTEGGPVVPSKYELYPVGSVPLSVSNQMIQMALKNWVKLISTKKFPFLIFNGVAVKIPVFLDKHIEMQIVIADNNIVKPDVKFPYGVMHPGNLNEVPLYVMNSYSNGDKELPKWPIQPMLQYTDVASIDPPYPTIQIQHLGGMDKFTSDALYHIDMCLGSRPVADCMFRLTSPGLRNGMLLITGPKGVGKTSLAKAICRKLADPPNLAHFSFIDCKPLRGKRPDSIVKLTAMLFEEAAWRQPAVILLDDLDHVAPAPTGPEAEFSAEAVYGARVAEVFKDVMRHEICEGSRIAVIATCTSRSTIHPLLVNTRGTHFVQEFIDIPPPDKDGRKEILQTILTNRPCISPDSVKNLRWDVLKSKTEGYVACDLDSLVSRALHSHHIHNRRSSNDAEVVLTHEDFEIAFIGFTPSSIRNVPLHTAGDLGWEDVGGLTDVKSILEETLLYPSKYPELFANCPLRLRSGILLYGAPGTGKTLLAGVLAKECGLNFISIKGPELLSKYIGASEQAVRDNFVRAQSAKPCILFFDEFDSIAPRRGHDNTGVTDRVVNQLLTQLDGVEGLQGVYVLAATSRPDLIDPALLRPGRLDKCVKCEIPNKEERLKIFESLTRKMTINSEVDFQYFAEKCEYFTGADIKALLYNAQLEAIHEVTGKLKGDLNIQKNSRKRSSPRKSQACPTLKKGATFDSYDSDKKVLYIPKLEEGIKVISEEMEEKLLSQVEHIQARLMVKKSLEHISTSENLFSPVATSKPPLVQVRQKHMLAALEQTRPSVGLEERNKYKRIKRPTSHRKRCCTHVQ